MFARSCCIALVDGVAEVRRRLRLKLLAALRARVVATGQAQPAHGETIPDPSFQLPAIR